MVVVSAADGDWPVAASPPPHRGSSGAAQNVCETHRAAHLVQSLCGTKKHMSASGAASYNLMLDLLTLPLGASVLVARTMHDQLPIEPP